MPLRKHILDFFQRPLSRLGETKENVYASGEIECGKDEVSFPSDCGETWGDGPCQCEVKGPVRGGCEGDGLGTDFHREDLSYIIDPIRLPRPGK